MADQVNQRSEEDEKAIRYIEEITSNADSVQEKVLAEILNQNKDVEYLKRFDLNGATDRETFKSKVPVISYEDIHSDIKRIANGDRDAILCAHPISEFFTSSGTSGGERKLIPITKEEMSHRHSLMRSIIPIMNMYLPDMNRGKGLYFMFIKSETRTPGGLLAQPALTSHYKSDYFKSISHYYTSPIESILCLDIFQSMYSQMLCGLLDHHNVFRIGTIFASGLVRAMSFLQSRWKELASDIMLGTLNSRITNPSIRDCIARILKPNPELSNFIISECSNENWEGIIQRIWPNTRYLDTIVTGSMAQYIPTLNYYSGGLPFVTTFYISSECFFGVNLNPMSKPSEISYTIMQHMAYFEFLPFEPNSSDQSSDSPPKPIDLVEVEVGKDYEILITNRAGLYRYRIGDILRVTGVYNSTPQFQFVRRKGAVLSIDSDKTDEAELQKAVENASQLLHKFNINVIDYTSYADTKTIAGHYVIFWELLINDKMPSDDELSLCCLAMEESLNSVYRQGRVEGKSIGPLEIRVVKNGTFEELMNYAISKGASISQYKVPRCVNSEEILKILDSKVLSSHFSSALPHWRPERKFT